MSIPAITSCIPVSTFICDCNVNMKPILLCVYYLPIYHRNIFLRTLAVLFMLPRIIWFDYAIYLIFRQSQTKVFCQSRF